MPKTMTDQSWPETRRLFVQWLKSNKYKTYSYSYCINRYARKIMKPARLHMLVVRSLRGGRMPEVDAKEQKVIDDGFRCRPRGPFTKKQLLRHFDRLQGHMYPGGYEVGVFLDSGFHIYVSIPDDEQPPLPKMDYDRKTIKEATAEYERMVREKENQRRHIVAVIEAKKEGKVVPSPPKQRRRVDWSNIDELHEQHGGDTETIAQVLDCSDAAVQRIYRMHEWKIDGKGTGRGRQAQYDWSNLEQLRDEHNGNTEAIAQVLGCSAAAVERRFRMNSWTINKPKPEGAKERGGKKSYSAEEEQIIRDGMARDKTNEQIVMDLKAAGYERTEHAITYARTRKFNDGKKFDGKVAVT